MSVKIDLQVVDRGSDEYVEAAWELKEHIRRNEGVLKQRRGFFTDAYQRSKVHVYVAGNDLAGFVATRRDGYILFLASHPDFRGEGIGKRLVARVADEHRTVTCHARTSNENALQFYEHLGFEIERRIDNYYEDGGDAYYLKLGEEAGLADRLSKFLRR
ncbi:MAG TPA: N-acetyltransferase [Natrialbaceae archaeon]|nr:N-acetyltransferase [Natrialbaceae archaeon]